MEIETTNTSGEIRKDNIPDAPKDVAYINIDSPETLKEVEDLIKADVDSNSLPPLNRAQRRALAKKAGKKHRKQLDLIGETAKKLDYIDMIQKLRELNKKRGEEEKNNGQATED